MEIRLTQNMLYGNIIRSIHTNLRELFRYQLKLSSGLDLQRPSDDPFRAMRALSLRSDEVRFERYEYNVREAMNFLDASSSALQEVSNVLTDIRAIAIQGATGTTNAGDREILAKRIDQHLGEVLQIANSTLGGRFLFGGTETSLVPFVMSNEGNSVVYRGNGKEIEVEVGPAHILPMNLSGERIFLQIRREPTRFHTETGAAPAGGSDSGTGNDVLQMRHTTTVYGDGSLGGRGDSLSGVRPGAGSGAGDTILGALGQHTLTLSVAGDGSGGTVSLDGGPPVSFNTSVDSNLAVTNAEGDVVYLDLTGVTSGFSGNVAITAHGEMSLDDGKTWEAIDFSPDQLVKDSETGAHLHVNTSGVVRAGDAYVTYTGTLNLFQSLIGLRDDLLNTRGLSFEEQTESILQRLQEFDRNHNQVIDALQEAGGRMANLEMTKNQNDSMFLVVQELLSGAEDTNIPEAVVHFTQQTNLYQTILGLGARILETSLLNFLG